MTPDQFDSNEQEILASYERDEWQSVPSVQDEIKKFQEFASAALGDLRLVSVHLPLQDFEEIRRQALAKGVPYQTFIADLIHRFVSGRLVEQS